MGPPPSKAQHQRPPHGAPPGPLCSAMPKTPPDREVRRVQTIRLLEAGLSWGPPPSSAFRAPAEPSTWGGPGEPCAAELPHRLRSDPGSLFQQLPAPEMAPPTQTACPGIPRESGKRQPLSAGLKSGGGASRSQAAAPLQGEREISKQGQRHPVAGRGGSRCQSAQVAPQPRVLPAAPRLPPAAAPSGAP